MNRHRHPPCTACTTPTLHKPPKLQKQLELSKRPKPPTLAKPAKVARTSAGTSFETYGMLSLSGTNNGSGMTGDHPVHGYADLTPHWYGSGGYTSYIRSDEFTCGWASVLGDGRYVYDLYLYWGTLDAGHVQDVDIRAAASGTVVVAGGTYGTVGIETEDGDYVALLHNRAISVKTGQRVVLGQSVGIQSLTGVSHVHLHIEAPNYILRPYVEGLLAGLL